MNSALDQPSQTMRCQPGASLVVGGLTPLTTIDYPGELAAVVFCQGCPWRCAYCHNAHLQPRAAVQPMAWSEVLNFLQRRRGLLDGVVFSGGEPTLQRSLRSAMAEVHALGYKVGLHTAGCYPTRLRALLPHIDWVGLDIKALPQDYAALTSVPGSGEQAFASLRQVLHAGVAHEVRITLDQAYLPAPKRDRLVALLHARGARAIRLQPCRSV